MEAFVSHSFTGKLDARFEVRRTASGADVVCAISEQRWEPSSRATNAVDAAHAALGAFSALTAGGSGAMVAAPAQERTWAVSTLTLEERFASIRSVGEECIQVG